MHILLNSLRPAESGYDDMMCLRQELRLIGWVRISQWMCKDPHTDCWGPCKHLICKDKKLQLKYVEHAKGVTGGRACVQHWKHFTKYSFKSGDGHQRGTRRARTFFFFTFKHRVLSHICHDLFCCSFTSGTPCSSCLLVVISSFWHHLFQAFLNTQKFCNAAAAFFVGFSVQINRQLCLGNLALGLICLFCIISWLIPTLCNSISLICDGLNPRHPESLDDPLGGRAKRISMQSSLVCCSSACARHALMLCWKAECKW